MADGDTYEVDSLPIASERGHKGDVLIGLFLELLVVAQILAEADLEEDEGAVLAVEGVDFRALVGRHSSGVDDVGGCPRFDCHKDVQVFLR